MKLSSYIRVTIDFVPGQLLAKAELEKDGTDNPPYPICEVEALMPYDDTTTVSDIRKNIAATAKQLLSDLLK